MYWRRNSIVWTLPSYEQECKFFFGRRNGNSNYERIHSRVMKYVTKDRTNSGGTLYKHTIFGSIPRTSYASLVLLTEHYKNLDPDSPRNSWQVKVKFNIMFLKKRKRERKSLICVYCGKQDLQIQHIGCRVGNSRMATVDHFIPTSKGGEKNNHSNMVVACLKCNTRKSDTTYNTDTLKYINPERLAEVTVHVRSYHGLHNLQNSEQLQR
jgi:5-methylcytosine-specific restriction endonuclease McrA